MSWAASLSLSASLMSPSQLQGGSSRPIRLFLQVSLFAGMCVCVCVLASDQPYHPLPSYCLYLPLMYFIISIVSIVMLVAVVVVWVVLFIINCLKNHNHYFLYTAFFTIVSSSSLHLPTTTSLFPSCDPSFLHCHTIHLHLFLSTLTTNSSPTLTTHYFFFTSFTPHLPSPPPHVPLTLHFSSPTHHVSPVPPQPGLQCLQPCLPTRWRSASTIV